MLFLLPSFCVFFGFFFHIFSSLHLVLHGREDVTHAVLRPSFLFVFEPWDLDAQFIDRLRSFASFKTVVVSCFRLIFAVDICGTPGGSLIFKSYVYVQTYIKSKCLFLWTVKDQFYRYHLNEDKVRDRMLSVDQFSMIIAEAPSEQCLRNIIGVRGRLADEWYWDPRGSNDSWFSTLYFVYVAYLNDGVYLGSILTQLDFRQHLLRIDWGQSDKGVGKPL